MGPLGFPELLFILVLALLIFGPRKIPEIGRTLGKAMGEFRRATNDFRRTINVEAALDEDERPATPRRPAAPREKPAAPPSPAPAESPAQPPETGESPAGAEPGE